MTCTGKLFNFSPQVIDFYRFEEVFHLGSLAGGKLGQDFTDSTPSQSRKSKRIEHISLLDTNRLRNCGMCGISVQGISPSIYDPVKLTQPDL